MQTACKINNFQLPFTQINILVPPWLVPSVSFALLPFTLFGTENIVKLLQKFTRKNVCWCFYPGFPNKQRKDALNWILGWKRNYYIELICSLGWGISGNGANIRMNFANNISNILQTFQSMYRPILPNIIVRISWGIEPYKN